MIEHWICTEIMGRRISDHEEFLRKFQFIKVSKQRRECIEREIRKRR